jgi:hypothetical protein
VVNGKNLYRVRLKDGTYTNAYGDNKPEAIAWLLYMTDKYKRDDIVSFEKEWIPPLCGVKWLQKHKGQHSDFVPSIEIVIDGKSKLNIKGDFKKGTLK